MTDAATRRAMDEALGRLVACVEAPRALAFSADDRAIMLSAAERARAQLLGPSAALLTVGLAGGTGVGKSTLINALAGEVVAEASEIRPTTRQIQVYHHRDDTPGNLAVEFAGQVSFVPHDRPELRLKMLVDCPDLDSLVTQHRATTRALLKRAGLVLYVFSPERYLEERTWSVLREEMTFSGSAAVLNKADRVGSVAELDQITEDLRERFAGLNLPDIRIFRVCSRAHVPDPDGTSPDLAPVIDDMGALRAYIERELESSEIARLLRSQRKQVVVHLRAAVDRIAPEATLARLDDVGRAADVRTVAAAERLASLMSNQFEAVEAELAPMVTLRRHERFWGPFRAWLAVTDFIGFGLTSLARRLLGRSVGDRTSLIERLLARGGTAAVNDLLRAEAYAVQDLLYARGLPVERWRAIAGEVDAPRLIAEVAAEIEAHFDVAAAQVLGWRWWIVWGASTLGGFVPSAFVLVGLYVMIRDVMVGGDVGLRLLWHLLAVVVLFFLALQGVVGAVLPGGSRWLGPGSGPRAVREVVTRTLEGWIAAYRAALVADVADLREPLGILQGAVGGGEGL